MSDKQKHSVVFISGRFRSGTSMLWNIFNQLPNYCAWYEPLHPNLLSHIQFIKPKEDHLGIDDYWQHYKNLKDINKYYCKSFGQKNIVLEQHEKWPQLKNYIQYLIDHSGDNTPVLQFNRMDLRLNWLKNTFPQATIITIEREAYPLWISSRKHLETEEAKKLESHPDAYDLMQWSVDISKHFQMLQPKKGRSSYYRHYFIWKLCALMAKANSNLHLSLENDFHRGTTGIDRLKSTFNWSSNEYQSAVNCIQDPESNKNTNAMPSSFKSLEKEISTSFKELGLSALYPSSPISSIKLEYKNEWNKFPQSQNTVIQELLTALSFQKDELTNLLK